MVADGQAKSIGHLFAASIINGGPGPGFLSPWVYWYLVNGTTSMNDHLPAKLPKQAAFCDIFELVGCLLCNCVFRTLTFSNSTSKL